MSTITMILEPSADGCVHLPVPAEMQGTKIKVTASLEAAEGETASGQVKMGEFGRLIGTAPLESWATTSEYIKAQAYGDE